MARGARSVSGTTKCCHICGLPIPSDILSPTHHLFGTIDHVVALSRGGLNELANRRAAHYLCNRKKSDRDLEKVDRNPLRAEIRKALRKTGMVVGGHMMKAARERCNAPFVDIPSKREIREAKRAKRKAEGVAAGSIAFADICPPEAWWDKSSIDP